MHSNSENLRTIARSFGTEPEPEVMTNKTGSITIRTDVWDWTLEPFPSRSPISEAFKGILYEAIPEVFIEGGNGLRSRLFAIDDDGVFILDQPEHLQQFIKTFMRLEDAVGIATFVERCQGDGRIAQVYRADGELESMLDEDGQRWITALELHDPAFAENELEFWSWRVLPHEGMEVVQLEHWIFKFNLVNGAEWRSERLPKLLHLN